MTLGPGAPSTAIGAKKHVFAALAVPGVAAAVVLTTVILTPVVNMFHLEQNFTWQYALVFGALIAASAIHTKSGALSGSAIQDGKCNHGHAISSAT